MELTVECQKRAEGSKPNALRQAGRIPAVLYGHNGTESVALTLDNKTAITLVRSASLNNTLIQVNVPDLPWKGKALLREVQAHPWKTGILYHLSFFSVAAQDSLAVDVPLHFVGDSPGVKAGGALDTVLTELHVQCAPADIPEGIEIDVSNLNVGDALHVHELVLPKGVEALGEPDRVVVSVLSPRTTAGADTVEDASAIDTELATKLEALGTEEAS
jgi:large subunit ribosomal protein L25